MNTKTPKTPKAFDKTGIYRTRGGQLIEVTDYLASRGYPLFGYTEGHRTNWDKFGLFGKGEEDHRDLVEYIDPEKYPEEYL